jgi:hypothetical protein
MTQGREFLRSLSAKICVHLRFIAFGLNWHVRTLAKVHGSADAQKKGAFAASVRPGAGNAFDVGRWPSVFAEWSSLWFQFGAHPRFG